MERVIHPFPPIYDSESRILILGTFPSVKSREGEFYYHHPQNRFWRVISGLFNEPLPVTLEEKKQLLKRNRIAVWDVIQSCEITGSSDSSIRNVVPNDIPSLLLQTGIREVFANGGMAYRLYQRYIRPHTEREILQLSSTSPANAGCSLEQLMEQWSCLKTVLTKQENSNT